MEIIAEPKEEREILVAVDEEASPDEIYEGIVANAEYCVVHLCGCK